MDNQELHQNAVNEFIALANRLKDQGGNIQVISAALMSASAVYATYTHAGNEGYLRETGMQKIVDVYSRTLENIQRIKQANIEAQQQAGNSTLNSARTNGSGAFTE